MKGDYIAFYERPCLGFHMDNEQQPVSRFIDEVRALTAQRQNAIEAEKEEARQKKIREAARIEQEDAEWAHGESLECKDLIKSAASEGEQSIQYIVAMCEREVSNQTVSRSNKLMQLLKQEGFCVRSSSQRDEPHGSDPYFPYTVYTSSLIISWY